MARVWNCRTPAEAWELVSHHLGNGLLSMSMDIERIEETEGEEADKLIDKLRRKHMELTGAMYILVYQMNRHGHPEEAEKIGQILELFVNQDVSEQEGLEEIRAKHRELDPDIARMEKQVDQVNSGNMQV